MRHTLVLRLRRELAQRLNARAAENRRSASAEAIAIFERSLLRAGRISLPAAVCGTAPIPPGLIDAAIREGRH